MAWLERLPRPFANGIGKMGIFYPRLLRTVTLPTELSVVRDLEKIKIIKVSKYILNKHGLKEETKEEILWN